MTHGIGVIGLGFMGRTHVGAYRAAAADGEVDLANRLVAVCDPSAARRAGGDEAAGNIDTTGDGPARLFDPGQVRTYERPEQLLADGDVDVVSVCTYTDTHVDLAIAALDAGKHVLVEKPVALTAAEAERLAARAARAWDESRRVCMPAMCIRFWPGWNWLAECIAAGTFGHVRHAVFRRTSPVPDWAPQFYGDLDRCGGALFDLHVHDADFVRWCFGDPTAVHTSGSAPRLTTRYVYGRAPLDDAERGASEEQAPHSVVVSGTWDDAPHAAFNMAFTVEFERAEVDYDFARDPSLLVTRGSGSEAVGLPDVTGYDGEVRHLLAAVAAAERGDPVRLQATVDEAVGLMRMLEAEARSLTSGRPVSLD